jgi:hypothetical protein
MIVETWQASSKQDNCDRLTRNTKGTIAATVLCEGMENVEIEAFEDVWDRPVEVVLTEVRYDQWTAS